MWDRRAFPAGMEGQSRQCPTKGGWGALKDRALRDASVLGDQPAVQDGWSMGAQETRRGGHSGVSGDQAAADALGPCEAFGLHPPATGREAGCKSGSGLCETLGGTGCGIWEMSQEPILSPAE